MYLVTTNVDGTRESVREVKDQETLLAFIDAALTRPHFIEDGGAILIRRANYLDKRVKTTVDSKPKLTLILGGMA